MRTVKLTMECEGLDQLKKQQIAVKLARVLKEYADDDWANVKIIGAGKERSFGYKMLGFGINSGEIHYSGDD